jgi:TnpA family transposase
LSIDTPTGDQEHTRFGRLPALAELERFFLLDDADHALVARRRGDHNRLGFALQLGTVRYLGTFLADPTDVPDLVVDYVAEQVGAADPSCLKRYMERRSTRFEHTAEIAATCGYRDFSSAEAELSRWIDDRAWTTGDGPSALSEGAVAWLRERQILLPGTSRLERLVARIRDAATQRLWDVLTALLTPAHAQRLELLLEVPEGARTSDLERLRKGPTKVSGKAMATALDRIAEISGLGLGSVALDAVPHRRVLELARWGMTGKASALRRQPSSRKVATLLATAVHLKAQATDDALELFDLLMTNDLMARAHRDTNAETLRRYPQVTIDAARCAAAVRVLLESADRGDEVTLATVWREIENLVSREELRSAVDNIAAVAPPPHADSGGEWRAALVERYAMVRRFIPKLCTTIEFGATAEATSVLQALLELPQVLDGRATKRVPAGYLDARDVRLDVVPAGWWRPLVLTPARPDGTVDRPGYVFCVLEQFHQRLRRRDIFAIHSSRWSHPRARLLSGLAWDIAKGPALNALQLPAEPDEFLVEHATDLDAALRHVTATLLATPGASIDADGRLHADKVDAIPDPASLTDLRRRCEAMLPRVDIGEVVLEVMTWVPGFVEAFTAASGGEPRLADLDISIAAALTAQALNIGYTPVISPGVRALTRGRISHVDQNYLRAENFAAANTPLIDAQAGIALAQAWGGGLVAAVDGIRFVVPVRSIDARPNPKFFGRRRGSTWLTLVSDQAVGLAGKVVSGTPRDSLHLVDLIYRQDGGRRPEVIIGDTGSYSDIVFGLLRLLGFEYRPLLADLPETKLWRINPSADYGPLRQAARGKVDVDRIRQHWPDILRIVGSVHTGAVSAHDVIRMLNPGGKPTQLGDALAHYGRIFKTLHVLSYVDDEAYRRQIKGMRNLQEGRHDLARHIFHGRKGELRESYHEGMEDQLGALGLALNCITLWNTVYLDAVLARLRTDGYPVRDEDAARLSAYMRRPSTFTDTTHSSSPSSAAAGGHCATRMPPTTIQTDDSGGPALPCCSGGWRRGSQAQQHIDVIDGVD